MLYTPPIHEGLGKTLWDILKESKEKFGYGLNVLSYPTYSFRDKGWFIDINTDDPSLFFPDEGGIKFLKTNKKISESEAKEYLLESISQVIEKSSGIDKRKLEWIHKEISKLKVEKRKSYSILQPIFSGQKEFSLSGRLKASKKVYKEGKEFYNSPEYKKETEDIIKDLESYDSSKYYKTESAKRAARKQDKKEITRLRKGLGSPKKLAFRDAYHTFKSPYWEDKLYSEKKKTKKDRLKKFRDKMVALENSINSSNNFNDHVNLHQQFQQDAWNSHVIGVNAHSIATMGHPIM